LYGGFTKASPIVTGGGIVVWVDFFEISANQIKSLSFFSEIPIFFACLDSSAENDAKPFPQLQVASARAVSKRSHQ